MNYKETRGGWKCFYSIVNWFFLLLQWDLLKRIATDDPSSHPAVFKTLSHFYNLTNSLMFCLGTSWCFLSSTCEHQYLMLMWVPPPFFTTLIFLTCCDPLPSWHCEVQSSLPPCAITETQRTNPQPLQSGWPAPSSVPVPTRTRFQPTTAPNLYRLCPRRGNLAKAFQSSQWQKKVKQKVWS